MVTAAYVQPPPGATLPPYPRFMLHPLIPLKPEYLAWVRDCALTEGIQSWGRVDRIVKIGAVETYLVVEKEWDGLKQAPMPHQVDLHTIVRGLDKVFDLRYDLPIEVRHLVLTSLYDPSWGPRHLKPRTCDVILQLALFDQLVYPS